MAIADRGIFVTGTDTGVGKSIVAASICAALASRGERVAAFKPAVSGLDESSDLWPPDHELLAAAASAGQSADEVAPYRFGAAVSPHLAAEMEGIEVEPDRLRSSAEAAAGRGDVLIVEGVGGLLVPLSPGYLVRDFAVDVGLPVLIAASPGLGTINHTLLSIEAVLAAGLSPVGVVITPWPAEPTELERSNRHTVAGLSGLEVSTLSVVLPDGLAEGGGSLPIETWLSEPVGRN